MKRQSRFLLFAGTFLLLLGFSNAGGATDLTGTIADSTTGLPLSGVVVKILETGDSTATNAGGHYFFGGLTDGAYTILIGRSMYRPTILTSVLVGSFLCGDIDGDTRINIGDPVYLINYIFKGGPAPNPLAAGDVNADARINIGDAVHMINYIFKSGPAPQCL